MFFIAYTFNGQVHVFEGQVNIVSHSSCRTSAILKYVCPLNRLPLALRGEKFQLAHIGELPLRSKEIIKSDV